MPGPKISPLINSLRNLGFSDLEANVYVDLLKNPGSTGYRIGKSINKPHANVYQALVSLEQKGAVQFEEGDSRTYSAIAPDEMLGHLRAGFQEKCREAENSLKALEVKVPDEDRFFRLTTRDQVYARARTMIREATDTILVEAFPGPAGELRPDLEGAIERGIAVAGLAMEEGDVIDGSRLVLSQLANSVTRAWAGDPLTLIVDAHQFLLALFDRKTGEVVRALWANSPFASVILNNGIVADVILHSRAGFKDIESPNAYVFGHVPKALKVLLEMPEEEGEGAARD
jgi:sugar-specific transcriptional regulator TrmB